MAFTKKNDEAVSPVIGVILMVAVTVILAAVIAAFVFGMAGNLQKGKTVAITAQRTDGTHIQLTNMGGPDVGSLSTIASTVDNAVVTGPTTSVGSSASVVTDLPSNSHVIVTGTFTDGSKIVLLDTRV